MTTNSDSVNAGSVNIVASVSERHAGPAHVGPDETGKKIFWTKDAANKAARNQPNPNFGCLIVVPHFDRKVQSSYLLLWRPNWKPRRNPLISRQQAVDYSPGQATQTESQVLEVVFSCRNYHRYVSWRQGDFNALVMSKVNNLFNSSH